MTKLRAGGLALCVVLGGCGGVSGPVASGSRMMLESSQAVERQVAVNASMELTVRDLQAATERVDALVAGTQGRTETSISSGDSRVDFQLRIPAASLQSFLGGVRGLGDVDREVIASTDVTDEVSDLDARLANLVAVRDRLRGYLEGSASVEEVIAVERELTRVQTEIDVLTGRLARLRGQVAMSSVDLSLHRKRTLGPLGQVAYGVGWVVKKLFVLG